MELFTVSKFRANLDFLKKLITLTTERWHNFSNDLMVHRPLELLELLFILFLTLDYNLGNFSLRYHLVELCYYTLWPKSLVCENGGGSQ